MINQSKTQPRCAPTAPDNSDLFFGLDTLSFFHVEPTVASDSGDIAKRPNVRCRTGDWREDPADEEWAISRNDRTCAAEPGAGAKTRLTKNGRHRETTERALPNRGLERRPG
jgi:hypothetical protein